MDLSGMGEVFQELKKEYDETIPEKLGSLKTLVEKIEKDPSEENIKELRFLVHKLAGSAGTYGYSKVSSCCKEFELELDACKTENSHDYLEKVQKFFSVEDDLLEKIKAKEAKVAVIGMGYIGLSLLEAFGAAGFPLIGYDVSREKVEMVQRGESGYNFLPIENVLKSPFIASDDPKVLDEADVMIISVSTALDKRYLPDLSHLKSAFKTLSLHLHQGQLIVLQSTTYPGTTEEELLPLLEESGMEAGKDFFIGYAPEILDPGNEKVVFTEIPKLVAGLTSECTKRVTALYEASGCEVITCASLQIAEAAKILQNTYRLVNISLVNEMKIMFDRMGLDVWEVIEAAASKPFGFTPFYPSAGVGGDCIAVVPTYLSLKAREFDGPTSLIDLAHTVNLSMPYYVVGKIEEALGSKSKSLQGAKVLVLGVGYKKDLNDLRESAPLKVLALLKEKGAKVFYHDPFVPKVSAPRRYPDLEITSTSLENLGEYDCVFIGTNHSCYDFAKIHEEASLIVDTHNVMPKGSQKVHKA